MLISGREKVRNKKLKNSKAFIDYSQTIDDVYESLEKYNPTKKKKLLIVFDDMTPDMEPKHWIVLKRKKTQSFTSFYIRTLLSDIEFIDFMKL